MRVFSAKYISLAFYLCIGVFLAMYLKNIEWAKLTSVSVVWASVALAFLTGTISRFSGGVVWLVILRQLGARNISLRGEMMLVYAKSWLGRYIPGAAPWILSRIYFAARHGISKNKLGVSSLLESGLKVTVTMGVALLWLAINPVFSAIGNQVRLLMGIGFAICAIMIIPPVFNVIVSKIYKLIRKKELPDRDLPTNSMVLRGVVAYSIIAIVDGLSVFFIAYAFYPELGWSELLYVMGTGNLSGAISMLAVFAPGGIGVREGIQLTLLSVIMPIETALLVTVATRLWTICVDLLFFALAKWQAKIFAPNAPAS